MNKKIIMIGAGGHATVLASALNALGKVIYAVVSPEPPENRALFPDVIHFEYDSALTQLSPAEYILVNGIGAMPGNKLRIIIFQKFKALGFDFMSIIHPTAIVDQSVSIGEGVQILTRAIIQPGCIIDDNAIINTGAIVEHDCHIGAFTHLAPGVALSGGVTVGNYVHIGTNATVIQGIKITERCIIGAGVTINKNLDTAAIVYPAKSFIRSLGNEG